MRIDESDVRIEGRYVDGCFGEILIAKYRDTVDCTIRRIKKECYDEKLINDLIALNKHPCFFKFIGSFEDKYGGNIVIEHRKCISLQEYLMKVKKERIELTMESRYKMALTMAKGLDILHKLNIYHENLQSNMVLLDEKKEIIISDLYLSQINRRNNSHIPCKIELNDSIRWKSPELLSSKTILTIESDVYSLGIVLWELLHFELPFQDDDLDDVKEKIKTGERPDISANSPKKIQCLIEKCWNHNKFDRPNLSIIVDVLSKLCFEKNMIFIAIQNGDFLEVARIVSKMKNINQKYLSGVDGWDRFVGSTALHFASFHGYFDIVKYLIEKGADVYAINAENFFPLLYSLMFGFIDIIEVFLKVMDKDFLANYPLFPIEVAMDLDHLKAVELLCRKGLGFKADPDQNTMLHICSLAPSWTQEEYKYRDCSIDNTSVDGLLLLHISAYCGCLRCIENMVKYKCDYVSPILGSRSPIHYAANVGHYSVVEFFVQIGVDVNLKSLKINSSLFVKHHFMRLQ